MKPQTKPASRLLRGLALGLGLLGLMALTGCYYQSYATAEDLRAHPPPGKRFEVAGLKYHLQCQGTGSPTLVLEAGLGESSLSWYPIQAPLARVTRVCAYDRAGLGWSEGTAQPLSSEQIATRLHELLQLAAEPAPYLLVGHSRGGVHVRNFYRQYPAEVAGMVLVDSVHDNAGARSYASAREAYDQQAVQMQLMLPLSRLGIIRLLGLANAERQKSPLPPEILAAKTAVQNRSDTAQAFVNELIDARRSLDPELPPPPSLGDLPLLVLTAGDGVDPAQAEARARAKGRPAAPAIALAKLDWQLQQELAALSSRSRHLLIAPSGHYIMFDQPERLIQLLRQFVAELRQQRAAG